MKPRQLSLVILLLATAPLSVASGCQQKQVSEAEGKAMMESFKGGPKTADSRAADAQDQAAAIAYRKAHPEQFPVPKFNVPPGGKSEIQGAQ